MPLGTIALLMALLSGGAGAIGMFGSGWLTDRLATRDARWRIWIMAAVVGITVPVALLQYLTRSTPVAIGCATIAATTMIAYYGPILAATQSATPPTMRAFGTAVLLLCFNLFGLGLGPWVTGMLSDALVPYAGEDALRFALAIVLLPSALATLLFLYAARFFTPEGQVRETLDGVATRCMIRRPYRGDYRRRQRDRRRARPARCGRGNERRARRHPVGRCRGGSGRAPRGRTLVVHCDVCDEASIVALADAAYARFGAVDLLCNNAGIVPGGRHRRVWDYTPGDWEWSISVNLYGVLHGLRMFVPRMIAQGTPAHILNTASVAGFVSGSGSACYGAAKHAMVRATEALYAGLREDGAPIGVTMLCPGLVRTRIYEAERLRPAAFADAGVATGESAELEAMREELYRNATTPEQAADMAFQGIIDDQLYVFTTTAFDPAIAARAEAILARPNPSFESIVAMSRKDAGLDPPSDPLRRSLRRRHRGSLGHRAGDGAPLCRRGRAGRARRSRRARRRSRVQDAGRRRPPRGRDGRHRRGRLAGADRNRRGAWGRLDVLVNNAGAAPVRADRRHLAGAMARDDRGQSRFHLPRHPRVPAAAGVSGRGAIVNVSSIRGIIGGVDISAYCAAKGGVRMFTKATALECAALRNGVRANSIHPGLIATPLAAAAFADPELAARRMAALPLGRAGEPGDIAAAILFAASDDAAYMTGAEIVVDGGTIAR